jgi:hypothetical protein
VLRARQPPSLLASVRQARDVSIGTQHSLERLELECCRRQVDRYASPDYARPRNGRIRPDYSASDQLYRLVSHFGLLYTKNHRNSSVPAVIKRSALCLFRFVYFFLHTHRINIMHTRMFQPIYVYITHNFIPMYAACIYLHTLTQCVKCMLCIGMQFLCNLLSLF